MTLTIRPLNEDDRAEWEVLYQGYAEFYKVVQSAAMRATVWSWIFDPDKETEALVVVDRTGKLLGLTHFRPYARPLSATMGCFLDDLFVSADARGLGAADALIGAVRAEAKQRGWSVVRWITAEDNYRARAVYDRLAERTKWVTYDLKS